MNSLTARRARAITYRKNRVENLLNGILMDIKQAAEVGRSSFCLKFGVQDLTRYVQVADLLVRLGYKCEIDGHELTVEWALDKNEDFWVWDHRREEFRCGRCGHITTTDELGATCPRCGASNGSIVVDVGHA